MTTACAKELTDKAGAGRILASVYRRHLFLERFSSSAYTYRFHPLFREFLLSKARERFEPEEICRIQRRAAAILESIPPIAEIQARVATSMSGALIIRKPHHQDLGFWLDHGLDLCRQIKDSTTQLKACIWSATYHMWNGDFARVELDKERAAKFIKRNAPSPMIQQFWKWLEISADIRTMDSPAKALEQILRLLEKAEKTDQHLLDHLFFPPGMFAALTLGDLSKAESLLKRFSENSDDIHCQSLVIYYHFQGLYWMLKGRLNRAAVYAESALKTVRQTGYVFYEALCLFQLAHLEQKQGKMQQANKHLKKAGDISKKTQSQLLWFMCLLKKAHMNLAENKNEKGWARLREALALGRRNDYVMMAWWWDPLMIAQLCAEALTMDIESDYARRIIRLYHLPPDPGRPYLEEWPWPVKIYTFGRFQALLNGKALVFGRRAPKKPLELLQALIAFGGVDVPVDRILDALWFDADGDMAQSAFSTALNRLRKLLQNKQTILLSNGRITLNPEHCWVDCLAFQNTIDDGDGQWIRNKSASAIRLYKQALSLYKGLFLCSEKPEHWIIVSRERFKHRFLSTAMKIGKWLEENRQFEAAMACYEKGLSVEDLEESLYQRLIVLQLHLGRYAEAVQSYRQCSERLSAVLNVVPSPKTQALYEQIIAGRKDKNRIISKRVDPNEGFEVPRVQGFE